ncbi:hypothetical protein I3843_Q067300 [Carya illinoinensis]|nr:hypothetical protein I3843_Q067300 [Carya illinoinensis]
MCFYFDILYGWIFTNSGSSKISEDKNKAQNRRSQGKQENQAANKINKTYGTNSGTQFERNLIESFESSNNSLYANVDHFKQPATTRSKEKEQKLKKLTMSGGEVTSSGQNGDGYENDRQQGKVSTGIESRLSSEPHQTLGIEEFDLNDIHAPNRSKWSGPFHFIQAADSQFGMIDSYTHKRTEPGWSEEIELCETLVATCNQMEPKPRFMIICGDLADAWPNTEIRRQQVVDFKRIFAKLDNKIPLVCVCGNHDVGDEPTLASVQEYRRNFGDDYFYFTLNDVLFIVINSQFYQHREFVQDYAKNQDQWLEDMLAKCKLFKYSIVFEHIPWFLEHFDEEDDYFNIKKEVRLQWLRKFKEAGVTKIMCGHYHRNAGGWYENMELVVTSAIGAQCGNDKSGVRIVKVLEESIEHQYYAMQDIPQKIQLSL